MGRSQRPLPFCEKRRNGFGYFLNRHCPHASEIDRTFAQEAGAAFDLVTNHPVTGAERAGQARFRRAKDGYNRNGKDCGQMHRPGVIREQQCAVAQFRNELIESGFPDAIHAGWSDLRFDLRANIRVAGRAEEDPMDRALICNLAGDLGKAFRKPALSGTIFGARTQPDLHAGAVGFAARQKHSHRWRFAGSAQFQRDSQITRDLVFDRATARRFKNDLIEQPAPMMTAVADPAGHAGQPDFKRGSQRIWEEHRDIETWLSSNRSNRMPKRTARQANHFIDLRNKLPDRGDLFGNRHRDMSIGPPRLDCAHSRHADHAVAEPV
jgi:hypothetical protein